MVPLFYDLRLRKFNAWAVLGVARRPLTVSFARPPSVLSVRDERGGTVDRSEVWIDFKSERHDLPYLVTAEVYVGTLLNRAEFQRLCDRHQTREMILRALE